jgi:hypothetical protein
VEKDRFVLHNYDVVDKMEYPTEDEEYDALLITGSGETDRSTRRRVWIDRNSCVGQQRARMRM